MDNSFEILDESEFTTTELIELHKELIRVIERDIDDAKSPKNGMSAWTCIAAMGAVAAVFFGLGKEIVSLHPGTVAGFFLVAFFLIEWFSWLLVSVDANTDVVKPYRLYRYADRVGEGLAFFFFEGVTLILSTVLLWIYWEFLPALIGTLAAAPLLFFFGMVVGMILKNGVAGNNPIFLKAARFWFVVTNLAYLLLLALAVYQRPSVGEDSIYALAVGALLAIFILLIELLLWTFPKPRVVTQLQSLRDDLVFRRLGMNEALLMYRRIREGALFSEMINPEFAVLNQKLDERNLALQQLNGLNNKIFSDLPDVTEHSAAIRAKLQATDPFLHAYRISSDEIVRLNGDVEKLGNELAHKASEMVKKSGDENSYNLMTAIIQEKDSFFQNALADLIQREQDVNQRRAQLAQILLDTASDKDRES